MNSTDEEHTPLAIVSLQMEDRVEEIKIYEGDDIEFEVELFCQRYKLGQDCMQYLVNQINEQLHKKPSPRFGDKLSDKLSFGQVPQIQPSESKQSDVGLTTQDSSMEENYNSAQKSYEQWQQKINQKLTQKEQIVQWSVQNSTRNQNSKIIQPNDRLYRNAIEQQQLKNEKAKYHKMKQAQIEQQQATFQPSISPRSREIVQNKRLSKPETQYQNIGQKLYQKGIDMNERVQQLRLQYQEKEKQLSPFQPRRLDTSRNHSQQSQNRSITPIYEKLFIQAKEDQKNKDNFINGEFNKIYPFHPQIKNPKLKTNTKEQQKQVEKLFKEQEERKRQQEKKQREASISNRQTFKPSINKDQIYEKVKKKQEFEDTNLIFDIVGVVQQNLTPKQSVSLSQQSNSLIHKQQNQTLFELNIQKIFNQLDGDKDGWISKEQLNLSEIDVEVLELVSEALYKIEEENIVADQIQFKLICQQMGLQQKLNMQL